MTRPPDHQPCSCYRDATLSSLSPSTADLRQSLRETPDHQANKNSSSFPSFQPRADQQVCDCAPDNPVRPPQSTLCQPTTPGLTKGDTGGRRPMTWGPPQVCPFSSPTSQSIVLVSAEFRTHGVTATPREGYRLRNTLFPGLLTKGKACTLQQKD